MVGFDFDFDSNLVVDFDSNLFVDFDSNLFVELVIGFDFDSNFVVLVLVGSIGLDSLRRRRLLQRFVLPTSVALPEIDPNRAEN